MVDCAALEAKEFCRRLVTGDTRCVESLWLHDSVVLRTSAAWTSLVRGVCATPGVVSTQVLDNYIRDAVGKRGLGRWLKALATPSRKAPAPARGGGPSSRRGAKSTDHHDLGKKLCVACVNPCEKQATMVGRQKARATL